MKRILLALALATTHVWAQAPIPPINAPVFRAFSANGAPLAGGKLFSYAAGTTTPLATYTDATGGSPNANPVILDSTGQANIFLGAATYKLILQDSNGVQQWSVDQIQGKVAGGLISFNGRTTAAAVPTTGDYDCAQVTGAICSIPNPFYQTVQVSGTPATQEPILNLIPGTHVTSIACVDNPSATSTDCTVNVAAQGDTATQCNGNGCWYTKPDGTLVEWGTSAAVSTGADQNVVTVTFPQAFSSITSPIPLSFTTTSTACADTCGSTSPKNPLALTMVQGTLSTTGVTLSFTGVTPTGGGGGTLTGTIQAMWQAIGK